MSDFYRHICKKCGFKSEDPHFLQVCPDCSEPGVTNDIPVGEFSDEFLEDDDIIEDFPSDWSTDVQG